MRVQFKYCYDGPSIQRPSNFNQLYSIFDWKNTYNILSWLLLLIVINLVPRSYTGFHHPFLAFVLYQLENNHWFVQCNITKDIEAISCCDFNIEYHTLISSKSCAQRILNDPTLCSKVGMVCQGNWKILRAIPLFHKFVFLWDNQCLTFPNCNTIKSEL